MINKQLNIRLSDATYEKLDNLAHLYNCNRKAVINDLICGEYDRVMGNPELKELIAKLGELKAIADNLRVGDV